jgi:cell division protein FtsI/penicillin-binding protein 2
MKRIWYILPLLLVGLLQNAQSAGTPAKNTTRSSASKKKGVVRKPLAPYPRVDPTQGDNVDGDDLTIRRAAVDALGQVNGSIVVVDPSNGRILTMVNQKLGLKSGFIPCSTIKLVTALAALSEHIIDRDTYLFTSRRVSFNLTTAIAHSNNPYFSMLGQQLGYERVTRYAKMMGLGEKAGFEVAGEQPGVWPDGPPKNGGMGLMTAFGEDILMTPLELAALLSAVANGGTLYYLQYPRTPEETERFTPRIKNTLAVAPNGIADIKVGMRGAVDYGTARRANYDPNEPILGKTGTCTDFRVASHMGWFGSFNDVSRHQIVVVVMLTATNKAVSGGVAAGVAGAVYRNLSEQRYFAAGLGNRPGMPDILTTGPCCSQ